MKININFEGLNKIFCKLGLHRFTNWEDGYYENKYGSYKICLDCEYWVRRKVSKIKV